jgi:2-polyprenyl-3-methyl-5-hydroxy-6-metoxy-1,4-benzoquinol methylase
MEDIRDRRLLKLQLLNSLAAIESELQNIRSAIGVLSEQDESSSSIKPEKKIVNKNSKLFSTSLSTSELGPAPKIDSEWPAAVDQKMIVSAESESDKQFRALQVANLIKVPMKDRVILDVGCGESHNASEIANTALKVVGYDVKRHPRWDTVNKKNLILVTDRNLVVDHGPYDLIILYDVLDHIVNEDPSELCKWVHSLLSKDGTVFVRTHPWTSRTGGHHYGSMNKAFLHLVLTPDEAVQAGIKIQEPNLRVVRPMAAYEQWFKEAGLTILDKKVKSSEVEPFFDDSIISRIVKINWSGGIDNNTARKILSNHFIDYTLKKSV